MATWAGIIRYGNALPQAVRVVILYGDPRSLCWDTCHIHTRLVYHVEPLWHQTGTSQGPGWPSEYLAILPAGSADREASANRLWNSLFCMPNIPILLIELVV